MKSRNSLINIKVKAIGTDYYLDGEYTSQEDQINVTIPKNVDTINFVMEDNDVYVQIYYCTYEDGRIGLDVEGYIDNIHISSNVYGKENIERVEKVLLSIGINLNA